MHALLQTSLGQPIDRQTLEEAVMATEGLAKPDCAGLVREPFGIIAADLSQDDALALQAALRSRNIETEVIDASALPVLPQPRYVRALKLTDSGIGLVDFYDRETSYEWPHIVFAAAGGLLHQRSVQDQKMEAVRVSGGHAKDPGSLSTIVTGHHFESFPEFRLELFLPTKSPRVQWVLTEDSVITVNGAHLRLRDGDQLTALLARLGNTLAPEQTNLGIKAAITGQQFSYPSLHAFEEEIIWSFYQLTRKSL
ncbi:MAG TPA: hypothetical protein VMV72_13535 [Verrucomicrobiae bacterium]|nr:hypothetical protein [Verrucomicrobiae bacterium]